MFITAFSNPPGEDQYLRGNLDDGTPYMIRVPANWNGVLFNDLDMAWWSGDADGYNERAFIKRLREEGCAVSGTERRREPGMWDPAEDFRRTQEVLDIFRAEIGMPGRIIAIGMSAGGAAAIAAAENPVDSMDAAIAMCATTDVLIANQGFDFFFILKGLLAPDDPNLRHYDFYQTEQGTIRNSWQTLLNSVAGTPEGRARIALAFTMSQYTGLMAHDERFRCESGTPEDPVLKISDPVLMADAMMEMILDPDDGIIRRRLGRLRKELYLNGRLYAGNNGIDYFHYYQNGRPEYKEAVATLYGQAGLDIETDIKRINAQPRLRFDPAAASDIFDHPLRTHRGTPQIPVFRLDHISDYTILTEHARVYEDHLKRNGLEDLCRSSFVDSFSHIGFLPDEQLTAVKVIQHRLDTGEWPDTDALSLKNMAASWGLDETRFVNYRRRRFNGQWRLHAFSSVFDISFEELREGIERVYAQAQEKDEFLALLSLAEEHFIKKDWPGAKNTLETFRENVLETAQMQEDDAAADLAWDAWLTSFQIEREAQTALLPNYAVIENPGNAADTTGIGAADYIYRISKRTVSIQDWASFYYDPDSGKAGLFHDDYIYWENAGYQAPASKISFHQAAQYCNWLTTGNALQGAYTISENGEVTAIDRTFRNQNGVLYVLPSADEWYKAAYFKPDMTGYSFYADGTDTPPLQSPDGRSGWNYDNTSTNWISESAPWEAHAGSEEQNGTLNMAGNMREWLEDLSGLLSPGDYSSGADQLASTAFPVSADPAQRKEKNTFRVVVFRNESAGGPITLMNDCFNDGNRDNQNLPDSAQWFSTSTHADALNMVETAPGEWAMRVGGGSVLRGGIAYFTDPGDPVILDADYNKLVFSIDFTPLAAPVNNYLGARIAAFDSQNNRVTADGRGDGTEMSGWLQLINTGATNNNSLRYRDNVDDNLISSVGNYTIVRNQDLDSIVWQKDVPLNITLTIERLMNDNVEIVYTITDGINTASNTHLDETYRLYTYDTFGFAIDRNRLDDDVLVHNVTVRAVSWEEPFEDWIKWYGLSGADADPDLDFDGDGFTNWQEYIADTDPTRSNSFFQSVSAVKTGSGAEILFRSSLNRIYELWFTPNLTEEGEWELIQGPRSGTGGADLMIHGQQNESSSGFYRVKVYLP